MKYYFRVDRGVAADIMVGRRSSFPSSLDSSSEAPDNRVFRMLGFGLAGMIARSAYLPFKILMNLGGPSQRPGSPLIVGALQPTLGFVAVSLPSADMLLYLLARPIDVPYG